MGGLNVVGQDGVKRRNQAPLGGSDLLGTVTALILPNGEWHTSSEYAALGTRQH